MSSAAPLSTEQPNGGLLDLENELVCSICTEILYQPLTLLDCLHTFCGSCLKEWFSLQANAARSSAHPKSNPYTCPSCRTGVRETRPNATVTTLLEMLLKANPGRERSDSEKAALNEQYKPGENIVPPVRQEVEREHRRRRRRHGENADAERDSSEEDRRLMEEALARSLRETRLSPEDANRGNDNGSRSRSRSRSAETREERHARRRREEERRRRHAHGGGAGHNIPSSPAVSTAEPANEAGPRRRERHVEHQASLRSLMSVSDGGMEGMEEEILRQIVDEGLLEGINLDGLSGNQEDELSERIAEAYRRRHITHSSGTRPEERRPTPTRDSRDTVADRSNQPPRHASSTERRHHSRSHSANTQDSGTESRRAPDRLPPLSRPHLLESTGPVTPPTSTTARRRRASDHSRRKTSPVPTTQRTSSGEVIRQAARSATDLPLSGRPLTSDATGRDRRPRQSSENRRMATDSGHEPRISEMWRHGLTREDRAHITQSGSTESPQHLSPTIEHPPSMSAAVIAAEPRTRHGRSCSSSNQIQLAGASTSASVTASPPQLRSVPTPIMTVVYTEPSVSCFRCQKSSIEHSLHRHCSKCDVSLCLRCYRMRRGCNHWFGFGPSAILRWEASAPRVSNSTMKRPHTLIARKWLPPPSDSVQTPPAQKAPSSQAQAPTSVLTTSDPSTRLQFGLFCDHCHSHADACFWFCSTCNDGEWGFCNSCVNKHHICTHPLLPLANRSTHPNLSSISSASLPPPPPHLSNYVTIPFTTHCDRCRKSIPPSEQRYHCPFHPPSGDYDICPDCYKRLMKSGKIRHEDGPSGWRRCPGVTGTGISVGGVAGVKGHRMIVVGFEDHARRVVVQDLVGGWRFRDVDKVNENDNKCEPFAVSSSDASSSHADTPSNAPGGGVFTWHEPSRPNTPMIKEATTTSSSSSFSPPTSTPSPIPPSGGFGATCVALYSYIPDPDDESTADELMFPRGAEIAEAEDVNGDWWWGVYLGQGGVWPGGYARVVRSGQLDRGETEP